LAAGHLIFDWLIYVIYKKARHAVRMNNEVKQHKLSAANDEINLELDNDLNN
jgi:hypothetical protein